MRKHLSAAASLAAHERTKNSSDANKFECISIVYNV